MDSQDSASRLKVRIGSLELANPIMPASGTFGSGKEYDDFLDIGKLGAVVTKSVTLEPTQGNPPPRVTETPSGMLNAIGLQNEGVDYFIKELLPPLREKASKVVVNIAGKTEDDYVALTERLVEEPIDALEVNISCPNVKEGGMAFGTNAFASGSLIRRVRDVAKKKPLWVKLSPNVTNIAEIAQTVQDNGADVLVIANTFLGMAVDVESREPTLGNVTGGLSGPAIHPMALRLVWEVRKSVIIPIIGVGGVESIKEVLGFMLVGASAVQVGAMNFVEPGICGRLVDELDAWLKERDMTADDVVRSLIVT